MVYKKEVRAFVARISGWFEEADSDETTLRYATRAHGSICNNIRLARRIGRTAEMRFPGVRATVETVDEWTHVNLHLPRDPGT